MKETAAEVKSAVVILTAELIQQGAEFCSHDEADLVVGQKYLKLPEVKNA